MKTFWKYNGYQLAQAVYRLRETEFRYDSIETRGDFDHVSTPEGE